MAVIRKLLVRTSLGLLIFAGVVALCESFPTLPRDSVLAEAHDQLQRYQARIRNSKYYIVIDYDLPVIMKRLWVIERGSDTIVIRSRVSHAWNSGFLMAHDFSNTPGTEKSSLGAFVTGEEYWGKFGYSMHLMGLERGNNDAAFTRAIVFHAKRFDLWSDGCFMSTPETNKKIIDLTKDGSLVYVHKSALSQSR